MSINARLPDRFCRYHGKAFVRRDISDLPAGRAAKEITGQTKVYEFYCPLCRKEGMNWERAQKLVKEGKWDRYSGPR